MKPYASYFTLEAVAGCLVRQRLKLARQRHDAHALRSLGSAAPAPLDEIPALWRGVECLPPRNEWIRPKLEARRGCDASAIAARAIHATIRQAASAGRLAGCDWGRKLLDLAQRVDGAAANPAMHEFRDPVIRIAPKAGGREFRAIASFEEPVDHVLLSLGARCLRDVLDPWFLPCSYAFRGPLQRTQHDAVEALLEYRMARAGLVLRVAECDLRMFYDHVGHDVVRERLAVALHEVGVDACVARRLQDLVGRQLAAYTFRETALARASEIAAVTTKGGIVSGLDEVAMAGYYRTPSAERLGIPQGSALSGVLANLVLHEADEAVMAVGTDVPPFYARYCDDMILVHEDRDICLRGLEQYIAAARRLKLVVHEPSHVGRYDAGFYRLKSKLPYDWGPDDGGGVRVPWVSFVGYQVRHDGRLRVRKSSLEKEAEWQAGRVNRAIDVIRKSRRGLRCSVRGASKRVEMGMAAHAAGRTDIRSRKGEAGPSWIRGFDLLRRHPHLATQLRWLDRQRGRQMSRLHRALRAAQAKACRSQLEPLRASYCGAPFSYHGAVGRSSDLARLPGSGEFTEYGH